MRDDYQNAKKIGDKYKASALLKGKEPYLPSLETEIGDISTYKEIHVGIAEIPLDMIVGTRTTGRQNSFAGNFMPLIAEDSEFAMKWSNLYDAQLDEGLRDPVKAYEYKHRFYVQEGNKRVSVMKYMKAVSILADVTRLMPPRTKDPESVAYYEYVDFNKVTGLFEIVFSRPGAYQELAEMAGQNLTDPWPDVKVETLRDAFRTFAKVYTAKADRNMEYTVGDAFLIYSRIYPYDSLPVDSRDLIGRRIASIRKEIRTDAEEDKLKVVETPEEFKKASVVPDLVSMLKGGSGYSREKPLKAAFIYAGSPENSSWTYGHELGRLEMEEHFRGLVDTSRFDKCDTEEKTAAAIEAAAADSSAVIFTTSPAMMPAVLKGAFAHPKIKMLNCSSNLPYNAVRTYYARMYEAKFLMGVLAALQTGSHRIGYMTDHPVYGNIANINAFAIGAAMIDPACRIHLKWAGTEDDSWEQELAEEGVSVFSGPDLIRPDDPSRRHGIYRLEADGSRTVLAAPIWHWGRYYELIIKSVLNGLWDSKDLVRDDKALNYWYGMKSGVVDIVMTRNVSYYHVKLLAALRKGIEEGTFSPFGGELHSQNAVIRRADQPPLSAHEIITMNWLNDNVIGSIPDAARLKAEGAGAVAADGAEQGI